MNGSTSRVEDTDRFVSEVSVRFDLASLCARWAATPEQVLVIVDEAAGVMQPENVLPAGARAYQEYEPYERHALWGFHAVAGAEDLMPELSHRQPGPAVQRLQRILELADELHPLPSGWRRARLDSEEASAVWAERVAFVVGALLLGRQPR